MAGSPEFDALLGAMSEGTLDAAGRARLGEILRGDPEARRFYLEYCQMDALLRSAHGVLQSLEAPRRGRRWILAAAALLLIGLPALWLLPSSSRLESVVTGPAWVIRDGGRRKAETLRLGDRVVTGLDAPAALRFKDGTTLTLQPASQIQMEQAARIVLHEGALRGEIAPQPADRPLVFATPFAEASVIGTRFDLVTDRSETRLETRSGKMRFTSAGRSLDVAAGELATADAQSITRWTPVGNWTFAGMTALPSDLETVFCPSRTLHTEARTVTPSPERVSFSPAGLILSGMHGPDREHGLVVVRSKEEVGDDLILETEVAGGEKWSLGFSVSGDSFEGFRVIFAVMDYPNGIAVDTIWPVQTVVLARDPRRLSYDADVTLRVEFLGRRIRIWVDRELRIDTVLDHPLPEGRRRRFAISNFGSPPVLRALRVWKKAESP
jgi:ferric-dicitrate binding protein FerR (iron transport regulator)